MGKYNRVYHCAFTNKTSNALLIVGRGFDEEPNHFRIDHNYCGQIPDTPQSAGTVIISLDKILSG